MSGANLDIHETGMCAQIPEELPKLKVTDEVKAAHEKAICLLAKHCAHHVNRGTIHPKGMFEVR